MPVSVSQHCVVTIRYDITIHTHLKFTEIHHGFMIHEKATSAKLKSQGQNYISAYIIMHTSHIFMYKNQSSNIFRK